MTLLLNKFCCCCETRTGALVIGTLGWILTLAQIFAGVDQHANREENTGNRYADYESFHHSIYFKVGWGLIALLVCVLLIVGVYKKDKRYMLPWIVLKGLEAGILSILTVILFFSACINGHGVLFVIFFVLLLVTVLQWYFWLCVFSHYKELGDVPISNGFVYSTENIAPPQYMEKPLNMA